MPEAPDSPSRAASSEAPDARPVQVQYYAQLREDAGRDEETVETRAGTVAGLFDELSRRHGFSLAADSLRVAVNGSFVGWDTALSAGDLVVFIPPVSGG